MSAEAPFRRRGPALRLGLALSAVLISASAARAFDPLWSDPGSLGRGATLPGERDPIGEEPTQAPAQTLSLIEAVDLALGNNAQLKESWAGIKIQAAALGAARTAFLPTLAASGSRVGDGVSYPGYAAQYPPTWLNSYQASVSANWQVFNFGAGFFGDRSAGHLLEAALADHDAALQKSLTEVIQAYFNAFTAREVFYGDCRDQDVARRMLASVKRREARGVGSRSDTLQATTSLLKLVVVSNRDQGEYRKDVAVLVYDLGLPVDTAIAFPETLDSDFRYSGEDLKAWVIEAQDSHPAILSAQRQVDAARDAVSAAVANGLPSVDLSANYYLDGRPGVQLSQVSSNELLLAATVNIPIFDGLSALYKVRDAQARLERTEAALSDARGGVLRDVVKSYWDTNTAYQNLQASEDLLKAAKEGMAVVQRRFEKNAADLIEVFNAETALADARQERIRCLADWRSNRLRLVASVGKLGRAYIR
jgi:outer membrane protein